MGSLNYTAEVILKHPPCSCRAAFSVDDEVPVDHAADPEVDLGFSTTLSRSSLSSNCQHIFVKPTVSTRVLVAFVVEEVGS